MASGSGDGDGVARSVGDPGSARPMGLFSLEMVSQCRRVGGGEQANRVLLNRVGGQAHGGRRRTVAACVGKHLCMCNRLGVVDFLDAALLALDRGIGRGQVLFIGKGCWGPWGNVL